MNSISSIVEMDIAVVDKFCASSDDAYLASALVPYEVSCLNHDVSNGSSFAPWIISIPLGRATCQKSVHGWYRLMMMPISPVPLLFTMSPTSIILSPLRV